MKISDKILDILKTKEIYVDIFTDYYDKSFYGFVRNFTGNFLTTRNQLFLPPKKDAA